MYLYNLGLNRERKGLDAGVIRIVGIILLVLLIVAVLGKYGVIRGAAQPLSEGANFTNSTIEQIKEEGSSYGVSEESSTSETTTTSETRLTLELETSSEVESGGETLCSVTVVAKLDGAAKSGVTIYGETDNELCTTDSDGKCTFTTAKEYEIYAKTDTLRSDTYQITNECDLKVV